LIHPNGGNRALHSVQITLLFILLLALALSVFQSLVTDDESELWFFLSLGLFLVVAFVYIASTLRFKA
jgi:hypothetical protein